MLSALQLKSSQLMELMDVIFTYTYRQTDRLLYVVDANALRDVSFEEVWY